MSARRRVQDENVASYRRPTLSASRKAVDQDQNRIKNQKAPLERSNGVSTSTSKQSQPGSKEMKGTFGKRERTGEKRAALVSLSNGAARAAQPPAQFANKRLPATIGTSAEKASSKRPGKSKKLLSIYTPANDLSTAPRHAIAAEDEVEYMPPSALDMPYQPRPAACTSSRDHDLFDQPANVPVKPDDHPPFTPEDAQLAAVDLLDFRFEG